MTPATANKMITVGIDASNIRAGGGVTHLSECLEALIPGEVGVKKVIVWAGRETSDRLPVRAWLKRRTPALLIGGGITRYWWRQVDLTKQAAASVDVLLVPGGSYAGSFRPYVSLAQNLLPFDDYEQEREGFTLKGARLRLLSWMQTRTFRQADGVIYMTGISQAQIERNMGFGATRSRVVHHGTNPRFFRPLRPARPNSEFTPEKPFRLLYLSILEPYKHQDVVVDAAGSLLQKGVPVALDLVGPGNAQDQRDINARIRRWDPAEGFIKYHGKIPYEALNEVYEKADAFIFASSCETFGIILLEAMAGGLPIICSHRSAMPEVVGNAAVYFDPLNAKSLSAAIRRVMEDVGLRRTLSFQAQQQARLFTWEKCARETFGFVREVYDAHQRESSPRS